MAMLAGVLVGVAVLFALVGLVIQVRRIGDWLEAINHAIERAAVELKRR